jgi:hypothetical protein
LLHVFSEGNSFHIISHEEDLFGRVDQVVKVNHTRMLQSLQALNLPLTCLFLHRILQLCFFVDFHCVFALVSLVKHKTHLCVGALSDSFAQLVILEWVVVQLVIALLG